MIKMKLSRLAAVLGGEHYGEDLTFHGVETDTRSLSEDSSLVLFVALKGSRFDGHNFLEMAEKKGVLAFLVSSPELLPTNASAVVVPDTTKALLLMAAQWRNNFSIPVVCIAGSNGKTTVRSMISTILEEAFGAGNYLDTIGNFNNHIGVPKSLFNLNSRHRVAVVEVGMNHPGEMCSLLTAVKPTISVVTNTFREHIGFMKSLEAIARENGEAYSLTSESGVCIINHDDGFFPWYVQQSSSRRQIWFGHRYNSHVSAVAHTRSNGQVVEIFYKNRSYRFHLSLFGAHNVMNAMAAFSVGVTLGISGDVIAYALSKFSAISGRLNYLKGILGCELIDDTYNANPDSTRFAIDALVSSFSKRRKFLVMGDMAEMGSFSPKVHQEIVRYARYNGVSKLFLIGSDATSMAPFFGKEAICCRTVEQLVASLKLCIAADVIVLVKGSRFMRMEQVVAELVEKGEG
ncbi:MULTISPECIES: UDP-N-acetylmuramoyl-tripeptide--D-alanyl-D-alanine ligase [Candidatus Ichthyocystis]|uniref:UDP-N-acetylmuramoyl-tripeptide--D-alanyl-D-alanine ligase n=1 Tax=Candidatus Ichthyocystis hellenicum TaxID=1561003 RepID=A0A0S4M2H0_9BURK|nr:MULTISPECIES: UDP-N-acetylmuramoyl-tripeptide--D-alanyl-D-alanine ligase [Ichthyocystis]CUT17467.1 UDP-N-acetylmuramoyl-tripeptide--D-alanyl-D-alanine ligase [Candidatus Ichthyocystis hellenicum]